MCDCIEKLNELLKPRNTLINVSFDLLGKMPMRTIISTVKYDDKNRMEERTIIATYCPFCGQKYEEQKPDVS